MAKGNRPTGKGNKDLADYSFIKHAGNAYGYDETASIMDGIQRKINVFRDSNDKNKGALKVFDVKTFNNFVKYYGYSFDSRPFESGLNQFPLDIVRSNLPVVGERTIFAKDGIGYTLAVDYNKSTKKVDLNIVPSVPTNIVDTYENRSKAVGKTISKSFSTIPDMYQYVDNFFERQQE